MLGVIVCGAAGRMGSTLVRLVHESGAREGVGAIESAGRREPKKGAGKTAGVGSIGVPITAQLSPLLKGQVVIIEFSTPEATLEHVKLAAEKKIPIVIGTTGSDQKQLAEIKKLSCLTPIAHPAFHSI